MSFLTRPQIKELAAFACWADHEARADLINNYIQSENQYTYDFVKGLRKIINGNTQTGLRATSFTLNPTEERAMGADAAIVVSKGRQSKVAVLEAKWPRFSQPDYPWDYTQPSGASHFSSQLGRQARYNESIAVFGMFYNEFPFGQEPAYLDPELSSCVWHENLEAFRANREYLTMPWTQKELIEVLANNRLDIGQVMTVFGECGKGKPIPIADPAMVAAEFRVPNLVLSIKATNVDKASNA